MPLVLWHLPTLPCRALSGISLSSSLAPTVAGLTQLRRLDLVGGLEESLSVKVSQGVSPHLARPGVLAYGTMQCNGARFPARVPCELPATQ